MELMRLCRIGVKFVAVPLFSLLWLVLAIAPAHAAGVVGSGTPGSCTDAAYAAAMAGGGLVTFDCGANPVTISVTTKVIGSGETATVDDGGGAINNNGGTVSVRSSTFISNTASNGGAINNASGSLNISTSLLYSSTVDNQGGGLFATAGTITVTNVTIANNAAFRGGGIYGQNNAVISVLNSTVYENKASSAAGGIWNNTAGAADNGGIALSYLPLGGSPAIDTGDNTGCPSFDQRGYPRPIGAACDIGSVEAGSALWLPELRRAQ